MQSQNLNQPPEANARQSNSRWKAFQPPPPPQLVARPRFRDRFVQGFSNLSIRYKICCGYALALGVAIGGTAIGLMVGNYYYQRASQQVDIDEESRHLRDLRAVLMQTQIDQDRLATAIERPELFSRKYENLKQQINRIKQLHNALEAEAKKTNIPGMQALLETHDRTIDTYTRKLEVVVMQIATIRGSKNGTKVAEDLLEALERDGIQLQFDRLMEDLAQTLVEADRQEDGARQSAVRAEIVRSQLIIASIILSIIIAALVANYVSQVITHSLKAVTKTARQVTEESDFDLQIPINSKDEVGVLAASLNQMIANIKTLLLELRVQKESQLVQSEKMASLGRMLAGVAHELNNPINFIYGNVEPAKESVSDLLCLIATYETEILNPPPRVLEKIEEFDLNFIRDDLPKLLTSMKVGAERAMAIISSLKDFSRLDQASPHPVDLPTCIESSLLLLNHRIKKGITVIRNYGELPKIEGYMGLLYQVFMNILSNAIDALEGGMQPELNSLESKFAIAEWETSRLANFVPTITITTEYLDADSVVVRIADNGPGMSPSNQEKLFQTFFTTKTRESGTGLGLAISKNIIVEKHGGTINCWSEVGTGTEFIIALPIEQDIPKVE